LTGAVDTANTNETGNRSLVLFDQGDEVTVQASDEGIRFLLVSGKPIESQWPGTAPSS
jgi:redox-sensitive bicupin YhaK (pirin superfamily)